MTTRGIVRLAAAALGVASMIVGAGARQVPPVRAPNPFEAIDSTEPRTHLDDLVAARLQRAGLEPAPLCSDSVFLRRAFVDVIGTLPTVDEVRAFLGDRSTGKRAALIDRLLEREEFADYWAMRWGDLLRVKSEFPVNLWPNAVQAYHRWIRTALRDRIPSDRVARDLLTSSGSNVRVPAVNYYRSAGSRDARAIALQVARTLMGARADAWPADRLADLAVFFSRIGFKPTGEWKEEIVFFDPDLGATATTPSAPLLARLPDGTTVRLAPDQDPREAFAAWLLAPTNPWFARAEVNRTWFWLVGRGIVHEADDLRPDNPPSQPELLAYLEREFVTSGFDIRHVCRLILNSATYQRSSIRRTDRADAEALFAHALLRPLDAEVLVDAVYRITGTSEIYSSAIPEPYTFIPPDQRTIGLADGSIRSTALDTFGRPARDTGLLAERNSRPTAAQRLHMLNSGDVQRRLQQGPALQALIQTSGSLRDLVEVLYLAILSRRPSSDELATALAHVRMAGNAGRRAAAQDLAWALLNTAEFRFRH